MPRRPVRLRLGGGRTHFDVPWRAGQPTSSLTTCRLLQLVLPVHEGRFDARSSKSPSGRSCKTRWTFWRARRACMPICSAKRYDDAIARSAEGARVGRDEHRSRMCRLDRTLSRRPGARLEAREAARPAHAVSRGIRYGAPRRHCSGQRRRRREASAAAIARHQRGVRYSRAQTIYHLVAGDVACRARLVRRRHIEAAIFSNDAMTCASSWLQAAPGERRGGRRLREWSTFSDQQLIR